jgi:hypothetical protein
MLPYRIKFERWANGPQREPHRQVIWQPFQLRVFSPDGVFQFAFGVLHAEVPTGFRLDDLRGRHGQAELEAAIIRWAVGEVECRLRSGPLPTVGTRNVEELELDDAHVTRIEQLAVLKTCAYQLARGRELFCSAAAQTDATLDPRLGMAPTSRPGCKICDFPDDHYRCSQLTHPSVIGIRPMTPTGRRLTSASCEIGSRNIATPSLCHAGGHNCWQYIVEPTAEPKKIGFT